MKIIKSLLLFSMSFLLIIPLSAQSMKKKFKTVKMEITINAPAKKVWEAMVLDYGNIANFSPVIYASNYESGSLKGEVGAERKCNFDAKGKRWAAKATKLRFTASRISSIDIRMTMTFLRFRKMPKTPSVNRIAATVRKCERPTSIV